MGGEDEDRERLAAALTAAHPERARLVRDGATTLSELPARFLRRTRLFEVEKFRPTRPTIVYAALCDDGAAFVLDEDAAAFGAMLAHDGGRVDGPAAAVELARTFLQVTRPQDRRFLVVSSADELPWMPGREADAATQRRTLATTLAPPAATPRDGGWQVELFVVDGEALERVTVNVGARGRVDSERERLFDELALTYTS